MNHGFPVESLVALPDGLFISAGSNQLKVWDVRAGARLLHTFSNHSKTITSLALDSSSTRLLSGSLDTHVKVYELERYSVTHTFTYSGPVLSVALSPDASVLAVGLVDGTLHTRQRVASEEIPVVSKKRIRPGSKRYFMRGHEYIPQPEDFKVPGSKKKRLRVFDVLLKRFEYREALDAALTTNDPLVVVSVLEELLLRRGLRTALAMRGDDQLVAVLKFISKHITNPHYSSLLIDTAHILLDIYIPVIGQSPLVDEQLLRLKRRIDGEYALQQDLSQLKGSVDLFLAAASSAGSVESASSPPESTAEHD